MTRTLAFTLIAAAIVTASSSARAQQIRTLDVGWDLLQSRAPNATGVSVTFRHQLGSLSLVPSVDLVVGWVRTSGSYHPGRCQLARQEYCFGGSESFSAIDVGVLGQGPTLGEFLGFAVAPIAAFGVTRSRSEIDESEGPTTFCLVNGQIVSCPDNPPFQSFHDTERRTLPSASYGLSLSRPLGSVHLKLGLSNHVAGFDEFIHRLRLSAGIGF